MPDSPGSAEVCGVTVGSEMISSDMSAFSPQRLVIIHLWSPLAILVGLVSPCSELVLWSGVPMGHRLARGGTTSNHPPFPSNTRWACLRVCCPPRLSAYFCCTDSPYPPNPNVRFWGGVCLLGPSTYLWSLVTWLPSPNTCWSAAAPWAISLHVSSIFLLHGLLPPPPHSLRTLPPPPPPHPILAWFRECCPPWVVGLPVDSCYHPPPPSQPDSVSAVPLGHGLPVDSYLSLPPWPLPPYPIPAWVRECCPPRPLACLWILVTVPLPHSSQTQGVMSLWAMAYLWILICLFHLEPLPHPIPIFAWFRECCPPWDVGLPVEGSCMRPRGSCPRNESRIIITASHLYGWDNITLKKKKKINNRGTHLSPQPTSPYLPAV